MAKMIAFCGLECTKCPSYLATINDDDDARLKTSVMLKEKYGLEYTPAEINCNGCLSTDGLLLGFCNNCKIRQCGREKGLENCTLCQELPCEKLDKFHSFSKDAKVSFESVLNPVI